MPLEGFVQKGSTNRFNCLSLLVDVWRKNCTLVQTRFHSYQITLNNYVDFLLPFTLAYSHDCWMDLKSVFFDFFFLISRNIFTIRARLVYCDPYFDRGHKVESRCDKHLAVATQDESDVLKRK